jgi:hypothetical protein
VICRDNQFPLCYHRFCRVVTCSQQLIAFDITSHKSHIFLMAPETNHYRSDYINRCMFVSAGFSGAFRIGKIGRLRINQVTSRMPEPQHLDTPRITSNRLAVREI